ncbi:hypothetical protein [Sphingobacterium sp. LRF_L2]|uniref:exo-rhamnogalacturonan lyase family protein n=1 Tax=Sphingobacterium sp. LRF_L2 TaxID=3369421 RepID=UPI003F5F9DE6
MTLNRRDFIKNTTLLGLAASPVSTFGWYTNRAFNTDSPRLPLRWINGTTSLPIGVTFGVPWSPGEVKTTDNFALQNQEGKQAQLQTWPLAFWNDGSVKWSAFASAGTPLLQEEDISLVKTRTTANSMQVEENETAILIDNGILRIQFPKKGKHPIDRVWIANRLIGKDMLLQVLLQEHPDTDYETTGEIKPWHSTIDQVQIENQGSERILVQVSGNHQEEEGKKKFPFILRFYIYKNSPCIKTLHTFIYNADEQHDFIKGIGLSLQVPLEGSPTYNRFVRFVGEDQSVFAEAVKGLTGLRRDPGEAARSAQLAGRTVQLEDIDERAQRGLPYIPEFGDYTLTQLSPSACSIEKRTGKGHAWIHAVDGGRSKGTTYLGTGMGGVAVGVRNFWQSYPAQLDIRGAAGSEASITAWLWSPRAPAMDLRFYHDGMGQDSYEEQWEGLEITYEDYEKGYGTPYGVGRTSELYLTFFKETPSNIQLNEYASAYQEPPQLTVSPEYLYKKNVFGGNWGLPDRSSPEKSAIENQLDALFDFYQGEVDRRGWYGFWNYGDVMHAYDEDRHLWRYDVGGFAWDNSELSTDLWLWYYYLRTGRHEAFRFAEAMCRHTGEVDVYHLGPYAPLGSRHNVMHWGCSAKQLRISTAINRRFYYYLTADERTGDLLREQVEAAARLEDVVALRKRLDGPLTIEKGKVLVSFGTDWGAIAAAWFTEWERTGNPAMLNRLKESMRTISHQPQGFFTGIGQLDLTTGRFVLKKEKNISVSHLNAVFGLVEICQEIIATIPDKDFEKAWLNYCTLYNATGEEREKILGTKEGKFNLRNAHARLTAYAAAKSSNKQLAARAWQEFSEGKEPLSLQTSRPAAGTAWGTQQEWKGISTNWAAQWGLTAIQCLHYVGKYR